MSLPNPYRFSLKQDDTHWYKWNPSTNIADTSLTPVYTKEAPEGWKDTEMKWKRSKEYWGLFRSISTPFQWAKDAARIIKYLYNTKGVGAVCKVVVEKFNYLSTVLQYEVIFEGQIDFNKVEPGFTYVTAPLEEGGIVKALDDNKNVVRKFSMDYLSTVIDVVTVTMDGIWLLAAYHYLIPELEETFYSRWNGVFSGFPGSVPSYPPLPATYLANYEAAVLKNKDGDYTPGIEHISSPYRGNALMIADAILSTHWTTDEEKHVYTAVVDQVITLNVKRQVSLSHPFSSPRGAWYRLEYFFKVVSRNRDTGISTVLDTLQIGARTVRLEPGFGTTMTFDDISDEYTITTDVDSEIRIYFISTKLIFDTNPAGVTGRPFIFSVEGELNIDVRFRLSATQIQAVKYYDLYKIYIQQIGAGGLISSYLQLETAEADMIPNYQFVTTGNSLRNLPNASFNIKGFDLFQDWSFRSMLGLGIINGAVTIERLGFFFNKFSEIYDLGLVTDFTYVPAEDYLFNSLKIGQEDQDYDKLNGRYEYNQTLKYTIPVPKETPLDMVSSIRRDMYGIEYTRANLLGKDTTDNESDNDVFVLDLAPVSPGVWILNRPQNTPPHFATGLFRPEVAYNLSLSPRRDLERNKPLFASITDLQSGSLEFQEATKNNNLVSNLGYGTITETEDVPVSSLGAKLFKPTLFRFKCISPASIKALMDANPNGYFSFTVNENGQTVNLKGFPWEIGLKGAHSSPYEFTLLCHPDIDLNDIPY